MNKDKLSTEPYKGVRDFYPEDKAVQNYIFNTWHNTARQFGFEEYDASVLEPSQLYKSKGAQNEEMVNEQTYTFLDRGDREVTLRPEMTPTAARMVTGRAKELYFPLRWYSIPNLFRYERSQRGRLREHWQLNCDIFGTDDTTADMEILMVANQIFQNFGAENGEHYKICVSHRELLNELFQHLDLSAEQRLAITRQADKMQKMNVDEFFAVITEIAGSHTELILQFLQATDLAQIPKILHSSESYKEISGFIQNLSEKFSCPVIFDPSVIRGFDYYTGIVFEIFDLHPNNNRALLGGGRYDDLTSLFGGEKISGVGFGMGDVTMRDFLESHNLLTADITAPDMMIIPTDQEQNLKAEEVAHAFRLAGFATAVDMGGRKFSKKIAAAGEQLVEYAIVVGVDEVESGQYTVKKLADGSEVSGTLDELISEIE
ncbi:histidine--tRNA ligase [bacterium]|nr:histidine--tRNA ligase [bacterium]